MSCHIAMHGPATQVNPVIVQKAVNGLDIERYQRLLMKQHHISQETAEQCIELFRKAMIMFGQRPGERLWVHEEADWMLHLLLLNTEDRNRFFKQAFGAELVHKLALDDDEQLEPVEDIVKRTAGAWEELFAEEYADQGTVWH